MTSAACTRSIERRSALRWIQTASGWCACLALLVGCGSESDSLTRREEARGAAGGLAQPGNWNPGLVTPATGTSGEISGANGCIPGHYVGSFNGTYNSAAWGNGAVPLSIEAVESMGRPGLEFWLEASASDCQGVEFCADFTVKGGKIRGFADPFSGGDDDDEEEEDSDGDGFVIAVPFEIDFGGELDCSSGQFRGLLQNGCYDVATILFRFEGTAPAMYDQPSSSFKAGQWTVKELAMPDALFPPDPTIGGMGSWDADLVNDSSTPVVASAGLCLM